MTTPARRPSRWDDPTCGAPGCTCHHDPRWSPTRRRCDRGHTDPLPGATTRGVRGTGVHTRGAASPDAVALCPTCAAARQAREARQ